MHRIVIRNRLVEQIEEDVSAYPNGIPLKQLVDQYGKPDLVTWSTERESARVAIFPNKGIYISATAISLNEADVIRVVYYRPRSLIRLLVDFKDEISIADPYPDSDVIGRRDPWFGTP